MIADEFSDQTRVILLILEDSMPNNWFSPCPVARQGGKYRGKEYMQIPEAWPRLLSPSLKDGMRIQMK